MDGRLHTTQNTYDYKTDGDMVEEAKQEPVAREDFAGTDQEYEEHCEACAI